MKFLLIFLSFIPALLSAQNTAKLDSLLIEHGMYNTPSHKGEGRGGASGGASSFLQTSQLGLMVYDLDADSTLYAFGEKQTLRPASTMKLLTAITALDRLGADYRFRTSVFCTGERVGRRLTGDLVVKGGMDPSFGETDMKELIEAVRGLQIDTIQGALVEDRSFKDENLLGEGWCWDDDNPVLTPLPYRRKDGFLIELRTQLDKAGIVVLENSEGNVPQNPQNPQNPQKEITTAMPVILNKMMKDSDNLYAEAVYYQIGAIGGKTSTAKNAQLYEKQLIAKLGVPDAAYRLADGSGLSLYNYVSAELEVAFLRYAYQHKNIFEPLYASLPIAGVDGTLKKRMTGGHAHANVRAKTGTLTAVYSLAGYATAANGHLLAFCIINQGALAAKPARDFQDQVCQILCE